MLTEGRTNRYDEANEITKNLKCTRVNNILCIVYLQYTLYLLLLNFLLEIYEILIFRDAIYIRLIDV